MEKTALLGLQWGDEGKGKVIDLISEKYDIIARYQGGHNAGHTVVADEVTYKLRQIPSGILHPDKVALLGSGMVIELTALFEEIEELKKNGISITEENLRIADNAVINLPLYEEVDQLLEKLKGDQKIGTTGKGIGIAYQDRIARRALRIGDLFETEAVLKNHIHEIVSFYAPLFSMYKQEVPEEADIYNFLISYKERIKDHIVAPYAFFNDDELVAKTILFEGAQGFMLDINWGTYPYVTSSSTHTAQIYMGSGIDFTPMKSVIGVLKAYTTRVGEGPFFTEDEGAFGTLLQERGIEVGTVTGRKRRCGALDLVAVRYACRLSGVTEIVLTKLDVLDIFASIPICVAYELDGQQLYHPPATITQQKKVKPFYTELLGWKKDISKIKKYEKLPEEALAYVEFIETYLRVPIKLISVGPDRTQNIEKIVKL